MLEFGPSRYCGASYTIARWLLGIDSRPRWLNEGSGEEMGVEEGESEGEMSSLRRMRERPEGQRRREGGGRWLTGDGDKLDF